MLILLGQHTVKVIGDCIANVQQLVAGNSDRRAAAQWHYTLHLTIWRGKRSCKLAQAGAQLVQQMPGQGMKKRDMCLKKVPLGREMPGPQIRVAAVQIAR